MRLYLAAPLFSVGEREFNARLATSIEALGFEVFLPQRDGFEGSLAPDVIGTAEMSRQIFDLDSRQVMECDVLVAVLDGRVPDEGMAVEIGLAYADRLRRNSQRNLLGLSTDFLHGGPGINAMLAGALDEILTDESALLERLRNIIA